MIKELNNSIHQLIADYSKFLLISHIRADGDAVGSVLGLGLSLIHAGKEVQMVLPDGLPATFRHLPGSNKITRKLDDNFEISIILDCSDLNRTNYILGDRQPDINIDHHITNDNFGKINLVDTTSVATTAIISKHITDWGLEITEEAAQALLNGLITDTLGFRTSNMTADTLRLAADLMDKGANLPHLYHHALTQKTFESTQLWGIGLGQIERKNNLIWTTLSLEDRQKAAYSGNDDADLINILSAVDGAEISIIFVEQKNDQVKVSWRATPQWNTSQIAQSFGGGGHPAASGAMINGTLTNVKEAVIEKTLHYMNNSTHNANDEKSNISTYLRESYNE